MKKKIISVIGFMLVFSILFSTAAMANQGRHERGSSKHAHYAEIVAKLINATPQEMDQLFAIGYTLEEMLVAAGKVEEFQSILQRYYQNKDKNIIIEIGDQNKKEDGMVVRIIAALDEKTDDKVKVEVIGLGDKIADLEKSKTVVLDSKKGVVDVYVTDGIYQNVLDRHRSSDYGMTNTHHGKNNLGAQTGNTQSRGRHGSSYQGRQAGYQAAPSNRGAAAGSTSAGYNTGRGSAGYSPGMGGTGYTTSPNMNTTGTTGYTPDTRGYSPGAGMNTTGTTGYTPGGMNTTGYSPGTGAARATGNVAPTGGYRGTNPTQGTPSRTGASANQGTGMNQTIGVMSSQTETNYPTEARVLGISQAQVKAAIDSGSTIFSLVSSAGKLNEYKEALIADNRAAFEIAIAEGKFDKETADKMRSYFEQKIAIWDGTTPIDMFKIKVG